MSEEAIKSWEDCDKTDWRVLSGDVLADSKVGKTVKTYGDESDDQGQLAELYEM